MSQWTKRFVLFSIVGVLETILFGSLKANQDLPLKPLSGINRVWLEKVEGASTWGRNPFYFSRREGDTHHGQKPGFDAGGFRVNAILYHKEGSVAIINHQIVRQGNQIEGKRVVSILADRVILQDLSGAFELKLSPFSTQ